MVPADTNKEVAGHTIEELLSPVPESFGLKAFGRRIIICLMEDILRESTLYVLRISKHRFNRSILSSSQVPQTAVAPPQVYSQ